jgi:hypothetical protein
MKKLILLLLSLLITACGGSDEVSNETTEEAATQDDPATEPATPELNMAELLAAMPQEPMPENPESLTRARSDGETVVVQPAETQQTKTQQTTAQQTTAQKTKTKAGQKTTPPPALSLATPVSTTKPAVETTRPTEESRARTSSSLSVESAAVAKNVVDRQPSGSGPFVDGSTVWTWNRILKQGDQNRTIRHIYYREGTQVVAVPLSIRGASWRTWSRTAVHGAGAWKVDIVDEEGRVLQSLPFVVK